MLKQIGLLFLKNDLYFIYWNKRGLDEYVTLDFYHKFKGLDKQDEEEK